MKTIVLALSTLFIFSFTTTETDKGPKYVIPKDTQKAAAIINEAFATPLKVAKSKVQAKNISYASLKDLSKLILTNKNISKTQKNIILKDVENWQNLRATIIDMEDFNICEGESNFTAIIEAGNVQTNVVQVFSTCGIFRCILSDPNGYVQYGCNPSAEAVKTVQLCTESSDLCCVGFYCLESKCVDDRCMEKNDCTTCN